MNRNITVNHVILYKLGLHETVDIMRPDNADVLRYYSERFPMSLYDRDMDDLDTNVGHGYHF